jgi:mRNA-degrading endonuclease RelE of RelBE toxin-antitoxin system
LAYVIEYSPEAEDHLRPLTTRQQRSVVDAVDRQLANQAIVETRNRKPMRLNPVAPWELRIGDKVEPQPTVTVLAIGVKQRDRVRIGGEIIKL